MIVVEGDRKWVVLVWCWGGAGVGVVVVGGGLEFALFPQLSAVSGTAG